MHIRGRNLGVVKSIAKGLIVFSEMEELKLLECLKFRTSRV
jgi:hypothetical protein